MAEKYVSDYRMKTVLRTISSGLEARLTPKEAATGLRIHLGGFFICVMVAEGAAD